MQSTNILVSLLGKHRMPFRVIAVTVIMLIFLWPAAWSGQQMLLHILMMAALAPAMVYILATTFSKPGSVSAGWLWLATVIQAGIFLFWHTPFGMGITMQSGGVEFLLQFTLLASAVLFWWSLLHLNVEQAWHAILALLVTGKLFCLVALLLTFAPRSLYPLMSLADQQLAGLIMITLCPLCYVAAAIWLCWQWLGLIEENGSDTLRGQPCA